MYLGRIIAKWTYFKIRISFMYLYKISMKIFSIAAIVAMVGALLFLSCEFTNKSSDANYQIILAVLCNGGTTNNVSINYYINDQFPIQVNSTTGTSILPIQHRPKATITATKEDVTASLTILVFKDYKMDKFSNLASCTTGSTTSCSNTLVLNYNVDDATNLTKTASGTTSSTSSTSSSSTSSSSTTSSSSSGK